MPQSGTAARVAWVQGAPAFRMVMRIRSCIRSRLVGASKANLWMTVKANVTYQCRSRREWVNAMGFRLKAMTTASLGIAVTVIAAACSSSGSSSPGATGSASIKAGQPKSGGSITVLENKGYAGDWPAGLDPATDPSAVPNQDMMEAIYGQLFELGANGQAIPDLATGYTFSPDAKDVTITLRQGVKFSDGTPFNAQAVLFNWNRDFGPTVTKSGAPALQWPIARVDPKNPTSAPVKGGYEATGPYTLVVHQARPNAAFINQLYDTIATWIVSPTALQKAGSDQAFGKAPVGAGPFTVVSMSPGSVTEVKKNPTYWDTGKPYLDQITFKTVGGDEAALEAMLAGEAQVYGGLGETALIKQAQQHFQVLDMPGTSPYDLQLNTAIPPFNDPKARQAIYAATNFTPILAHVFGNRYPVVQGFTGPGGIATSSTCPGTRAMTRPWPSSSSRRRAWTRRRSTWARSASLRSRWRPPRRWQPSGTLSASRPTCRVTS